MPLPWPNKLMFEMSGQSIPALPDPDQQTHAKEATMRKKKPVHARIDQVRITRDGNDAIIEYADPKISGTRLTIGPQIKSMTDREIVDVFNGAKAALEGSRYSRVSGKSSTTRKPASGYRAVTYSAASSTTAAPMAQSRFISTMKNCPSTTSDGYFALMPVGGCGSRSSPRTQ